eukprot:NODE_6578_length_869_cov_33.726542_g5982_i0.p1 GENE.NODE_6578_length_869_cov_33.726542_g5982_i0~~NODE_6578_length_869_cov_33.726542_g5982_i0.p1  ORF type:complete len:218 (+),score=55.96 NODE_6578_length_869_cov_33.726542_g5982_i0:57-710(+)
MDSKNEKKGSEVNKELSDEDMDLHQVESGKRPRSDDDEENENTNTKEKRGRGKFSNRMISCKPTDEFEQLPDQKEEESAQPKSNLNGGEATASTSTGPAAALCNIPGGVSTTAVKQILLDNCGVDVIVETKEDRKYRIVFKSDEDRLKVVQSPLVIRNATCTWKLIVKKMEKKSKVESSQTGGDAKKTGDINDTPPSKPKPEDIAKIMGFSTFGGQW